MRAACCRRTAARSRPQRQARDHRRRAAQSAGIRPPGCRFRPRCRFAIEKCRGGPAARGRRAAATSSPAIRVRGDRGARSAVASGRAASSKAGVIARRRRRRSSPSSTPSKFSPSRRRLLPPGHGGARGQRRHARRQARRDAGPGRRVRAAASPPSAALVLRLDEPTAGEIRFDGVDIAQLEPRRDVARAQARCR